VTEGEGTRPTGWREREGGGSFAGWMATSRTEVLIAFASAALIATPAVLYRVAFAEQFARGGTNLLIPISWALVSLPFWGRAVLLLVLPVRFRVENGRLLLRKLGVPGLGTATLALGDVRAVRAEPRLIVGKRASFNVWDVVVETQGGASHHVRLSCAVADEATWIARRVASAVGATPNDPSAA